MLNLHSPTSQSICLAIHQLVERTAGVMMLKERYTKVEAKKAKDAVARRVKNGSLEVMQGAAYKAHITKRTGRR
jgi:hypothetical protein